MRAGQRTSELGLDVREVADPPLGVFEPVDHVAIGERQRPEAAQPEYGADGAFVAELERGRSAELKGPVGVEVPVDPGHVGAADEDQLEQPHQVVRAQADELAAEVPLEQVPDLARNGLALEGQLAQVRQRKLELDDFLEAEDDQVQVAEHDVVDQSPHDRVFLGEALSADVPRKDSHSQLGLERAAERQKRPLQVQVRRRRQVLRVPPVHGLGQGGRAGLQVVQVLVEAVAEEGPEEHEQVLVDQVIHRLHERGEVARLSLGQRVDVELVVEVGRVQVVRHDPEREVCAVEHGVLFEKEQQFFVKSVQKRFGLGGFPFPNQHRPLVADHADFAQLDTLDQHVFGHLESALLPLQDAKRAARGALRAAEAIRHEHLEQVHADEVARDRAESAQRLDFGLLDGALASRERESQRLRLGPSLQKVQALGLGLPCSWQTAATL